MTAEFQRLPMGMCNCYLVKQECVVLVDAGPPNRGRILRQRLESLSIAPEKVSLLLLTHGHWDHIGSAAAARALTGCKVAINHREKDWVEQALKPLPPGRGLWGSVLAVIMKLMVPRVEFPGTPVDVVLDDAEFSLKPFGIEGRVIHTPGHTAGSMSLLLDTGDAFIGDLVMNGLPMRFGAGMPPLAEDAAAIKRSWRLLLDQGAKTFHPSHGNAFGAQVLARAAR